MAPGRDDAAVDLAEVRPEDVFQAAVDDHFHAVVAIVNERRNVGFPRRADHDAGGLPVDADLGGGAIPLAQAHDGGLYGG